MRKVLLTVLLGLSLSTIGQTKRIALFNKEFGGIRIVQQKVEVTDNVSSVVLMLSFQNQLYQHVSDFKVISINKKEDVEKLISNFESALSFSKSKEVGCKIGSTQLLLFTLFGLCFILNQFK